MAQCFEEINSNLLTRLADISVPEYSFESFFINLFYLKGGGITITK